MNSIAVMRLLQSLQGGRPTPALVPLTRQTHEAEDYDDEPRRSRKRSPPPRKDVRKKKIREPSPSSSSSSESEYGSPSSSDYSSYDEPEVVKKKFAKEPCEAISPAMLNSKKTKKEVVAYLEEKKCPKIETHAKKRKHVPPPTSSAPPARVPPAPSAPSVAFAPPAPAKEPTVAKKVGRPKKPVDPDAKPKKAPTAYNEAVGRHRKYGLSFMDAVKAAKEELANKKKD